MARLEVFEAIVEHDGAKTLIAKIEASTPADDYFDAEVTVLSEMIKHHVKEEEQPGGMFANARQSDMDLRDLGARLAARKKELMNSARPAEVNRTVSSVRACWVQHHADRA